MNPESSRATRVLSTCPRRELSHGQDVKLATFLISAGASPMLKWTVGHRKTAGVKRSPSGVAGGGGSGSGPCYSIRRAAAKLHLSRRRSRTPSSSGYESQHGGTRDRSKSCDKENQGNNDVNASACLSPRTRDSVYMRLDTIPAALRDVSNHYQAQTSPSGSPALSAGVKRSRSRVRKPRSLGLSAERHEGLPMTSLLPSSTIVPTNDRLKGGRPSLPQLRIDQTAGFTTNCTFNQRTENSSTSQKSHDEKASHNSPPAPIESPVQIEYSPCPVRTTKSLLALRRRLTDVFVQPCHSVPTLHPPQTSHDNPLYYTLQQEDQSVNAFRNFNIQPKNCDLAKSPSGNTDEVPVKFRRKDPNLCLDKRKARRSSLGNRVSYKQNNIEDGIAPKEKVEATQSKESLSPLSRNLASLRLSSGSRDGSILTQHPRVTPPSPFLNSTTFISTLISASQNQRNGFVNNLGVIHDVTDPRFLSLYSMLEPTDVHIESPSMETKSIIAEPKQESPHTPVMQGPVNRVLCYPEESPVKKPEDGCQLRKRPSLRRTRTLTSNSEEGPPVKVQPIVSSDGSLILPNHETSPEEVQIHRLSSPSSKQLKRCVDARTRKSLRRRSKLLNGSGESCTLKGLGDGVFTSENLVCDSVFNNEGSSCFGVDRDSFDGEESMLKRQGGIRRKHRNGIRNSGTSDSCLFKFPNRTQAGVHSGLTLPNGIPSPFSPQETNVWCQKGSNLVSNVGQSCNLSCHTVGLPKASVVPASSHHFIYKPSSTIISRLNGTVSCSDIQERPSHFGLTLPEGIPSPPSPPNDDDDQYSSSVGIAGVQPLSTSPVPPADERSVVAWRPKRSAVEDIASSSSDETWNSHNMHFMKTPRLTSGHMLHGAEIQETDNKQKEEEEEQDSSNGKNDKSCLYTTSVDPSPLALVERRSRSRRCLLFASPGGTARPRRSSSMRVNSWKIPKDPGHSRGELELGIYSNYGLLTIHIISGRNLHRAGGKACNAYVKVTLVPSSEERTFHRTSVHRESSSPWFDQKFSFELVPTDLDKRVFVSAWHRDKEKR
ncbi:hypothetical protein C0J52_07042 [Blattella germanica]|nr:hypothetical protein C0J52_07042 [Blattella germanica]